MQMGMSIVGDFGSEVILEILLIVIIIQMGLLILLLVNISVHQ